ncbi:HAD family hydrolase [Candidatus Dojkabacteria bacterium]|uniref:HAD family hydrolase n=1 Tax=Candidatus Dojkabacteria bacterium TaxID=2099670 RepID=A0A5C7J8X4_9BACT|nr:MAG: HAD family hydrolase [Candidatus Dojkabacteria bacterium]
MIKYLLLDADGVIINPPYMFSTKLAKEYGITLEMTSDFFTGIFVECIEGRADLKEVLPPYLKEWGWSKTVEDFIDYWFQSEHDIDKELVKYVQEVRSKGIKCFVATNQEKHRAEYMLNELGFTNSFDKVYASSGLGYKKPDQMFFNKILSDLGKVNKKEILFWDDTVKNVESAKMFGINAEVYSNYKDFKNKMNKKYVL